MKYLAPFSLILALSIAAYAQQLGNDPHLATSGQQQPDTTGQTFAVTGLTQVRMETLARGLPYICEVPYLGAVFHHTEEQRNEVALLVLVRPEIVPPPAKPIPSNNAAPQGEPHAVQPASSHIPQLFKNSP
jgi:hypothetical protein